MNNTEETHEKASFDYTRNHTLHIINKSPSEKSLYADCFSALNNNDGLLFIESAVYACKDNDLTLPDIKVHLYILQTDLDARGLPSTLRSKFTSIDDNEFVKLCCEYKKTISWF